MNGDLNLSTFYINAGKLSLIALFACFTTFVVAIPSYAHHPYDGRLPDTLTSLEGLISGFAHPIFGLDHFLFLLSIGLILSLSINRWLPMLLLSGIMGTVSSLSIPREVHWVEIIISLSIFASVLVSKGVINPIILLPLIFFHGYVFGDSMVGAELFPQITYCLGLILSQLFIFYVAL